MINELGACISTVVAVKFVQIQLDMGQSRVAAMIRMSLEPTTRHAFMIIAHMIMADASNCASFFLQTHRYAHAILDFS